MQTLILSLIVVGIVVALPPLLVRDCREAVRRAEIRRRDAEWAKALAPMRAAFRQLSDSMASLQVAAVGAGKAFEGLAEALRSPYPPSGSKGRG